jgi:hypothetical protein
VPRHSLAGVLACTANSRDAMRGAGSVIMVTRHWLHAAVRCAAEARYCLSRLRPAARQGLTMLVRAVAGTLPVPIKNQRTTGNLARQELTSDDSGRTQPGSNDERCDHITHPNIRQGPPASSSAKTTAQAAHANSNAHTPRTCRAFSRRLLHQPGRRSRG